MKIVRSVFLLTAAIAVTGCTHSVDFVDNTPPYNPAALAQPSNTNARSTCQAQYGEYKQNYLSAIQTHIAANGPGPMANRVPLDAFRAEINAAYNLVVARCKTHMKCLEAHGYDEAKCYIAAYDRKDAERAFADLALRLRELTQQNAAAAAQPVPNNVTVTTTVKQKSKQETHTDQEQKNDQDVRIKGCCKGKKKGIL